MYGMWYSEVSGYRITVQQHDGTIQYTFIQYEIEYRIYCVYISLFLYISSQRLYGVCVYFGRGVNGQPASHFGLFRVGCVYVRYFLSLIGFLFFCVQYLLFTSIYHSYGSHSGRCCRHAVVVFVVAYR